MKKLAIIGFLLVVVLVVFGVCVNYQHQEVFDVHIHSLVTQQEINGSGSNQNIETTYKYLVNTNKGVFYITPSGLYSSDCFGMLKEDRNYTITTRGYSAPIISMYPYIIVKLLNNESIN